MTPEELAGLPGDPGEVGAKGSVLNTEYAQIQTYAFHTQTNQFEDCPSGKSVRGRWSYHTMKQSIVPSFLSLTYNTRHTTLDW
jgi:hypothetical protein